MTPLRTNWRSSSQMDGRRAPIGARCALPLLSLASLNFFPYRFPPLDAKLTNNHVVQLFNSSQTNPPIV
ncbi:uncharacterized protein CYBJADRAFT_167568 [Cyberlindnera jadinii NRRL Y-1542]|uniref:Uncharacterized protein n=1 Tax=Cyberlindnera jadinii (strain ATCC 18201 / CBS 1600 / BCRC 20928 / JCM 3617 / NBRC 0987 / NRRL Y-1542) TaxID=983966 RepID=A0A1E4S291_CYBJN|nr:hypothetical protein CYBJADRAFT_167568 [Cyberlindnera jadinii NRRL Y-1542]ODV73532.1 hypothetical protein CYBJADRAFT_167568 [Cyberlindnera jadinii NRRL Y-1542]